MRKEIDWERIETDYRAGLLSVREIAATNGITHTTINKKAKTEGWERDLKARIQAKAEALVSKREVSTVNSTERKLNDKAVVEANAEVIANIRMAHRQDISRSRRLAMEMLSEVEHQTGNLELYEQLGELLLSDDDKANGRRSEMYAKVISSLGRIDSMKKLAETLRVLVAMEREAYGITTVAELDIKARGLRDFYGE